METTENIELVINELVRYYNKKSSHFYDLNFIYRYNKETNSLILLNKISVSKKYRLKKYKSKDEYKKDLHFNGSPNTPFLIYLKLIENSILNEINKTPENNSLYSYKKPLIKNLHFDNYFCDNNKLIVVNLIYNPSYNGTTFYTHNYIEDSHSVKVRVSAIDASEIRPYDLIGLNCKKRKSWEYSSRISRSDLISIFSISEFPNCCGIACLSMMNDNYRSNMQFACLLAYKFASEAGFSNMIHANKITNHADLMIPKISSFANSRNSNKLHIGQIKIIQHDSDTTKKKIFTNSKKFLCKNKEQASEPQPVAQAN